MSGTDTSQKINVKWQYTNTNNLLERDFVGNGYHYPCGDWMEFIHWLCNINPNVVAVWLDDIPVWNEDEGWLDSFVLIKITACKERIGNKQYQSSLKCKLLAKRI